ncbi:MAG TPA: TonB-dependent receptor [Acidisarcina sp.]|nr:TonB-dependent receptor [Acidisarcina sp.]
MPFHRYHFLFLILIFGALFSTAALAQSTGTSGSVAGVVTDSTGAVIPGASVQIQNPVTGFSRSVSTDAAGAFTIPNVAYGNYRLQVSQPGFSTASDNISIHSPVATSHNFSLQVSTTSTTVTVDADNSDIVENDPSAHTDLDRSLMDKLPMLSTSSALSSAITLASPGVTADSNGMFHPLGEHSDTSYSVDGQPISDQQSKTFSNQVSMNSIQSLEVISGVVPAEYGDKASLVARTTTRSGLGATKPTGNLSFNYGSYGSSTLSAGLGIGGTKYGNFLALDGMNSGRFLDPPEFQIKHARGNSESIFDRVDFAPSSSDSLHLNVSGARSWFQVPNQYDQEAMGQDQRSQIFSFNLAPFWTHIFSQNALLSVNPYLRQDNAHYYPSRDVFHDTPATLAQDRALRNLGIKVDYSYSHGIHNIKTGFDVNHTFLHEGFAVGITSPSYNAVCFDASGSAVTDPSITEPSQCAAHGDVANPGFQAGLLPYDLTRGGKLFDFRGYTDVKQEAFYFQDNVTWHNWQFLLGLRDDNYNGLTHRTMLQPRLGATYQLKPTGTVLRLGYGRLMPTPYNENLVLSSSTGGGGLGQNAGAFGEKALTPASRNQFNAGLEQGFGRHLVLDGDYFWKFTRGDYDFDVLLNTPLTFPIQWRKSKIDGWDLRLSLTPYHGFTAYSVMGHSRARFFGPESGGILFNNPTGLASYAPFRIDHDQKFEQTTHFQFQPRPTGGWYAFTWRYESGLVAGNAPYAANTSDPVDLTYLTADQQSQIKLSCGGQRATLSAPLTSCSPNQLSSPLISLPSPGTENADRNPPRIAPRNLVDMAAGWDNLFHRDKYKTNLSFTVTNLTNKVALYNFLSTFSGTHFVPSRAYSMSLALSF